MILFKNRDEEEDRVIDILILNRHIYAKLVMKIQLNHQEVLAKFSLEILNSLKFR